jgi:hypothetical protein
MNLTRLVMPRTVSAALILWSLGCQSEEEKRREQAAHFERISQQESREKFQTMTHESLTLSQDVADPGEMIVVEGVLHSTEHGLFDRDSLLASFVAPGSVVGNEERLEVTQIAEGRYQYKAEFEAPIPPGPYTLQIRVHPPLKRWAIVAVSLTGRHSAALNPAARVRIAQPRP